MQALRSGAGIPAIGASRWTIGQGWISVAPGPARERPAMLQYAAPSTTDEAVRILAAGTGGARVWSGGTDLLVQLRTGRIKPDLIVATKNIAGISGIREQDGQFIIGAATPGAVIGEHAGLVAAWPGVVGGANLIGSTQIQGRALIAGNLCNASTAADRGP